MNTNTALFFSIFNLAHKNPILDQIMIFGANYLIFFVVFFAVILFFTRNKAEKKSFIIAALGGILTFIFIQIIRIFIFEPRPFVTFPIAPLISTDMQSFPSIHTAAMAAIAATYFLTKSKFFMVFLFCFIWIAFARIFTGVHYPLDILGGTVIGIISAYLTKISYLKFFQKEK
ncbi:MAG: phosphatase PAP2 family protein [Candidatus Daviesbacteria bacterium]